MKALKITALALGLALFNTSCSESFVDREFYQSVPQGDLTSETEVESFVRGIYASMRSSAYLGRNYTVYSELRSDEMYSRERREDFNEVYRYTMTSNNSMARGTYTQIYTAIAKANIVINTDVNKITNSDLTKVDFHKGQALVLRGMMAFDLLRLYGQKYTGGDLGIVYPLVYNPDANQARGTILENEAQIEKDLTEGLALMEANAIHNPTTKTELSINAVKGLMTRFYLYKEDWQKVSDLVNQIYGAYSVVPQETYLSSWALNDAAPNSIFELAVGTGGALGSSSLYSIYHNAESNAEVVVTDDVYSKTTYYTETSDVRLGQFTRRSRVNYLTGKYTERNANIKVLRYEEILLNGAEAEYNLGNPAQALVYLNEIRANRGVAERTSTSSSLLRYIKRERVAELIGEGFRYWDLLRWGDNASVSKTVGGYPDVNQLAFPIPITETNFTGSLVVSNPGYDN